MECMGRRGGDVARERDAVRFWSVAASEALENNYGAADRGPSNGDETRHWPLAVVLIVRKYWKWPRLIESKFG